jgi:hypothetical protein
VRFIEILRGEGGQVGRGGTGRGVPPVRFGGPAGQPGFQLGQVIDEMISHPPDGLVRGVEPRRLAFDGCLGRDTIPPRPGFRPQQHVVHHAGDHVGGMPVIDLGPRISHGTIMPPSRLR